MALGAKLSLANPAQTAGIFQYILNLAKYDVNYDIRDRARVMRAILLNAKGTTSVLSQQSRLLFFTPKPVPQIASQSKGILSLSLSLSLFSLSSLSALSLASCPNAPDRACVQIANDLFSDLFRTL